MIRNLKVLGIALAAVFAISAVSAAGASAQQGTLITDGPAFGPVTLDGTELGVAANRLEAFGAFVECPGSTYKGHKYNVTPHGFITSGSTTATLSPKYKETKTATEPNCVGSLGTRATIDMNGCDYVIHLGETTGGVNGTYGVTFDVVCPIVNGVQQEITVTIWLSENAHTTEPKAKCTLHVPGVVGGATPLNQNLKGAHATDTGNGDITLTGPVTGITVKQTRHSILCPSGTHEAAAKFQLNVTVTGTNEAGGATNISLTHP